MLKGISSYIWEQNTKSWYESIKPCQRGHLKIGTIKYNISEWIEKIASPKNSLASENGQIKWPFVEDNRATTSLRGQFEKNIIISIAAKRVKRTSEWNVKNAVWTW